MHLICGGIAESIGQTLLEESARFLFDPVSEEEHGGGERRAATEFKESY